MNLWRPYSKRRLRKQDFPKAFLEGTNCAAKGGAVKSIGAYGPRKKGDMAGKVLETCAECGQELREGEKDWGWTRDVNGDPVPLHYGCYDKVISGQAAPAVEQELRTGVAAHIRNFLELRQDALMVSVDCACGQRLMIGNAPSSPFMVWYGREMGGVLVRPGEDAKCPKCGASVNHYYDDGRARLPDPEKVAADAVGDIATADLPRVLAEMQGDLAKANRLS
jgi:hypothetical protein